jgi:hypothetical protein
VEGQWRGQCKKQIYFGIMNGHVFDGLWREKCHQHTRTHPKGAPKHQTTQPSEWRWVLLG